MNRLQDKCRIDGQLCEMCAQWRCADADMVDEVCESVNGRENKSALNSRKIAEYYDLLMTNESIFAAFSTRESENRDLTPTTSVQSNMTHFKTHE